jgi:nitroreductase
MIGPFSSPFERIIMGFDKVCRRLLEYGVLAPSIYNSQPWRFQVDGNEGQIEVQAYYTNVRPFEIDPDQRDLYMALGACAENIALAAPALGYEAVPTLFPNEGTMVRLQLKALPEAAPENLFSSMLIRQTHAGKYKEESVADLHLQRLKKVPSASDHEKIYFVMGSEASTKVATLAHDLAHEASADDFQLEEATRWTKSSSHATEGVPMKAIGLPISVTTRFAFLRHWSFRNELKEVARQFLLKQGHGVEAPAYLLMTTDRPGRESYVQGGRWWVRLALTLSELELGSQVLSLPITLKKGHQPLREIFGAPANETPLLLIRFGQPVEKKWPRTNRKQPALDAVYFVE